MSPLTRCCYPWSPLSADATYRNPIICADYSDPDVIRVGDDYFLTASSFNCTPGLPILHSRDLLNWSIINHAIDAVPGDRYNAVQPGCGVWAPAIRHHAGKFWIFFPTPDEGIYVVTATHPARAWSPPRLLVAGKGLIDPCPLWDDDGRAYLVHAYANSRAGIKHVLRVRPMAGDASKLLGAGEIVFNQPERHPTLEGPKFHKRNGWYYLSAPAGGVATGWQVILRSRSVYGPYEDRIVLAQGNTAINGPHQGAIVDSPNGEWWFVHFQDAGVYGRIVHLQPMRWENDWPVIGVNQNDAGAGEPVLSHRRPAGESLTRAIPQTSDAFDSESLGLQWQWQANFRDDWHSLAARPGRLRLFAVPAPPPMADRANLLLQKLPAREFVVETSLEVSGENAEAGLVVMGKTHAAVVISGGKNPTARLRIDDRIVAQQPLVSSTARVRLSFADGGACRFFCGSTNGPLEPMIADFTATAGAWIGAKIGIFCNAASGSVSSGFADFDYFNFVAPA